MYEFWVRGNEYWCNNKGNINFNVYIWDICDDKKSSVCVKGIIWDIYYDSCVVNIVLIYFEW